MQGTFPVAHFELAYYGAMAGYGLYLLTEVVLPRWRAVPLILALLLQSGGMLMRAHAIGYFPLTNKFESFYAFSLAMFAVVAAGMRHASRSHRLLGAAMGAIFLGATSFFPKETAFPPPLMMTVWYPLHVPASFVAYALWVSAGAAALAKVTNSASAYTERAVDQHAFWGWCVFSISMLFGGAWGYVAWGATFLWDPKVVWSVVLWLFYSGFLHLRFWPRANRPSIKCGLAIAGVLIVMVAYVGTSFLFRNSSHSFG